MRNYQKELLKSMLKVVKLECCGHLSSFIIEGVKYDSSVDEEFELYAESETMDFKLSQVISVGDKFRYDYDFGSTTALQLEVIDEYSIGENHSQIEILARNEEVQNFCSNCNEKAEYFDYEIEKFFCKNCTDEDVEMVYVPEYTNSPRDGVCGYEGDRDTEKQYFPGNNFKFKKAKTKGKRNIVPFIEDDEFYTDDEEGDFDPLVQSVMNNMNLEIENRANKMLK